MNKFIGCGYVAEDPKLSRAKDGTPYTNIGVGLKQASKDKPPCWMKLTAWKGTAETIVNNLKKGSLVNFEATISTNKVKGVYFTNWTITSILFLSTKIDSEDYVDKQNYTGSNNTPEANETNNINQGQKNNNLITEQEIRDWS